MPGCIYQIVIAGGSRTYIGSAHSLKQRKYAHLCLLRKGTHHSRALQNAVNKHGLSAIEWRVLETVEDCKRLVEREQAWLDQFKGRLYNTSPTAESRLGATMSDAARAKISNSLIGNKYRKGIKHSEEDRKKISEGVKRANRNGTRRQGAPQPQNLAAYNEARRRGEIPDPRYDPERDKSITAHHAITKSLIKTALHFGIC